MSDEKYVAIAYFLNSNFPDSAETHAVCSEVISDETISDIMKRLGIIIGSSIRLDRIEIRNMKPSPKSKVGYTYSKDEWLVKDRHETDYFVLIGETWFKATWNQRKKQFLINGIYTNSYTYVMEMPPIP